jgi:hypothetical protein
VLAEDLRTLQSVHSTLKGAGLVSAERKKDLALAGALDAAATVIEKVLKRVEIPAEDRDAMVTVKVTLDTLAGSLRL